VVGCRAERTGTDDNGIGNRTQHSHEGTVVRIAAADLAPAASGLSGIQSDNTVQAAHEIGKYEGPRTTLRNLQLSIQPS
jgi:hypothetical protein